MLEPDVIDLLESGCGMLIGFVTAEGMPFADARLGHDGAR